jgi:hypothetical protein
VEVGDNALLVARRHQEILIKTPVHGLPPQRCLLPRRSMWILRFAPTSGSSSREQSHQAGSVLHRAVQATRGFSVSISSDGDIASQAAASSERLVFCFASEGRTLLRRRSQLPRSTTSPGSFRLLPRSGRKRTERMVRESASKHGLSSRACRRGRRQLRRNLT